MSGRESSGLAICHVCGIGEVVRGCANPHCRMAGHEVLLLPITSIALSDDDDKDGLFTAVEYARRPLRSNSFTFWAYVPHYIHNAP